MTCVREIQGIKRVHLIEDKNSNKDIVFKIQTEGVNFNAAQSMSQVKHSTIRCNDIHSIYETYGVILC